MGGSRGRGGRTVLGLGFGLALDVLGFFLIVSGSLAAGIAVLVISTFIVLGILLSRRGGPSRRSSYLGEGGACAGAGVVVDGASSDSSADGGFGGDGGGSVVGRDGSSPLLAQASKRGGR